MAVDIGIGIWLARVFDARRAGRPVGSLALLNLVVFVVLAVLFRT